MPHNLSTDCRRKIPQASCVRLAAWQKCIQPWRRRCVWERLAFAIWILLLSGISIRTFIWPRQHSVYPIYSVAGQSWVQGQNLYDHGLWPTLDLYRYSPLVAVLFVPFSLLPESIGGVLWRLVEAGVYFWGLAWWCRAVLPGAESWSSRQRAAMLLLLLPLSVESLNNGQANVLVIGLILAGVAGAGEKRWNISAICVALACIFKIYPVAVGILLVVLYPRQFPLRFVLALAVGLVLPFLFHHPQYVLEMYQTWMKYLGHNKRQWNPLPIAYRDLWLLFRLYFPISETTYLIIQLSGAAGIAAFCLAGRWRGCSQKCLLTLVTILAAGWMTLVGPATETCTYILLAPALAWIILEAWNLPRTIWTRGALVGIFALFLAKPVVALIPGLADSSYAVRPWAALLFVSLVVITQTPALFWNSTRNKPGVTGPALAA